MLLLYYPVCVRLLLCYSVMSNINILLLSSYAYTPANLYFFILVLAFTHISFVFDDSRLAQSLKIHLFDVVFFFTNQMTVCPVERIFLIVLISIIYCYGQKSIFYCIKPRYKSSYMGVKYHETIQLNSTQLKKYLERYLHHQ